MRTARLETLCTSVSLPTTRCYIWGAQLNKFEQVSSDDPTRQNDGQTQLKTLPFRNFVGG